jgi:hypothetical protein
MMRRFGDRTALATKAATVAPRATRHHNQAETDGEGPSKTEIIWPAWVQRCGVGSSCGRALQDQLAGVQRDLQRATAGGGAALPAATQKTMQRAFSADFSAVRIHTGAAPNRVASGLDARALTTGNDILFRSGAFQPQTPGGERLLAHELAHVVQQAGGLPRAAIDGGPADPLERAAEMAADHAVTAGLVAGVVPAPSTHHDGGNRIQRQLLGEPIEPTPITGMGRASPPVEVSEPRPPTPGAGPATVPAPDTEPAGPKHNPNPRGRRALSASLSAEDRRVVIFSRPVTAEEAATFVWGEAGKATLLVPATRETHGAGGHRSFRLNVTDVDQIMSMRHGLAYQYISRGIIRSTYKVPPLEEQMPKWLPSAIRDQLIKQHRSGTTPKGAQYFPGTPPWGSIVAWSGRDEFGRDSIQIYQEYPDDQGWYLHFTDGDKSQARLLHQVYTQFNRDMRYFIGEGWSPYAARDEIRRINDEVFKLVILGAFTILSSGVGIGVVSNQMRQTLTAAQRTGFRPIRAAKAAGAGRAAAVSVTGVADELVAATQAIANPGQKMLAAARQVSAMRNLTAGQKARVILEFFKRIGFAISKEGVVDEAAQLVMKSEDERYAFRFIKSTGDILYGKFNMKTYQYVWESLR